MNKPSKTFTQELKNWLDNQNRDYSQGVLLLYRLRANHTEYMRLSADPQKYTEYIFAQIKKFYDFRSSETTHLEVVKTVATAQAVADNAEVAKSRSGKREDHDTLPEEIKKCYEDNFELYHRIADTHIKMRLIIQSKAACKDADLMPLAQHIIKLDKQRLANWKKYDTYTPDEA